jgi:long-chain acyl-CoA synthetase
MKDLQLRREVHHGRVVACHADRPTDIYAMFLDAVQRAPDAIALVDGDERWSYAYLATRVAACAARLTSLGLAAGDRVAILLSNRSDYSTLLMAIARLGLIAVPMNIRQRPSETAYVLEDSGAAAVIYDDALDEQLGRTAARPHQFATGTSLAALRRRGRPLDRRHVGGTGGRTGPLGGGRG